MRDLITVKIDDQSALAALAKIRAAGINPRPLLLEIGEDLMATTKQRFQSSTAPDGSKWDKNSPATMARWLSAKSNHKKSGGLSKRGQAKAASKKPLIGKSKRLSSSITYIVGGNMLQVGSPMIYASTQQFGAGKGEFGTTRRGSPIPWGDIPAREFLGLSAEDSANIIDLAEDYLRRAIR